MEWEIFKIIYSEFRIEKEEDNNFSIWFVKSKSYENILFELAIRLIINKNFNLPKQDNFKELKEKLVSIYSINKKISMKLLEKNKEFLELRNIFVRPLRNIKEIINFIKNIESQKKQANDTLETLLDEI